MAPFKLPRTAFDPLDLAILEQALASVWDIVQARNPSRDVSKDEELKDALREKLIAVANIHGVSDPETLRGHLLGEVNPRSATDEIGKID